jgi:hypothetical protein
MADAMKKIDNNRSSLESEPKSNIKSNLPSTVLRPIVQEFVPFHSADIKNVKSNFMADIGFDRTEFYISWQYNASTKTTIPVTRTRTVTDWYETDGRTQFTNVVKGTHVTQIYADFKYPRNIIEAALHTDDLDQFRDMTATHDVSPHNMNMAYGLEKMITALQKMEERKIENELMKRRKKPDHIRVKYIEIHMDKISFDLVSYHIPAYIYQSKSGDNVYYKFVNGINGDYSGEIIYSPLKTSMMGGFGGLALGLMSIPFITNPYLTLSALAVRLAITSAIGSAVTTTYYNLSQYLDHSTARDNMKEEKNYNANMFETDEDRERKSHYQKTTKEANRNTTNINYMHIEDECRLLGLNPNGNMTKKEVRAAYHTTIKKWHPDIAPVDAKTANEMCARINCAYKKIMKEM